MSVHSGKGEEGGGFVRHAFVGVGKIGEGREEHGDRRGRGAAPWADDEREMVFVIAGAETNGVDTAGQLLGDSEGEIDVPAGIVEIVGVEVDGAVLLRGVVDIALVTGPV